MRYWLTTKWAPLENKPGEKPSDIWIADGREAAGSAIREGDLVLIYQTKSGPTELHRNPDGVKCPVRRIGGKEGIIAIARVKGCLWEETGKKETEYDDRTKRRWCWHAPTKEITSDGFVPRVQVNRVLGYKPTWSLRGFGRLHSGLKEITKEEYDALVKIFKTGQRPK
ncbi:MAG: hypothetical protein KKA73_30515 [Chloroflexi bacterium]|nr:hypothetical protein [Chloroflexota bacterium]MBU1752034.1 hypothetical protein [Chloroflexota bacterium]